MIGRIFSSNISKFPKIWPRRWMWANENCCASNCNASHSNGTYRMCGPKISFRAVNDSLENYCRFKTSRRFTRSIWMLSKTPMVHDHRIGRMWLHFLIQKYRNSRNCISKNRRSAWNSREIEIPQVFYHMGRHGFTIARTKHSSMKCL